MAYIASLLIQQISERLYGRMSNPIPITVAHGDGIGPEIMAATLHILQSSRR